MLALCIPRPFPVLAALACSTALSAQTAQYTYHGYGCEGSGAPQRSCVVLNDQNPILQVASLPNEYAYPVVNSSAGGIQVVGFEVWTRSNSGTTTEVGNTGIALDSAGPFATTHTTPSATYAAAGTIAVGPTAGWYATTLIPPLDVPAGAVFWITLDAYGRIAPPQHDPTGAPGPVANYWRRVGTAWAASGSVFRPIYRIRCASDIRRVPYLSASNPPRLGQPISLEIRSEWSLVPNFFAFGVDRTQWYGLATPFDLGPLGAPHCSVYCSWDIAPITIFGDASRRATLTGMIPSAPYLIGQRFYNQGFVFAGGINPLNLLATNLGAAVIGT